MFERSTHSLPNTQWVWPLRESQRAATQPFKDLRYPRLQPHNRDLPMMLNYHSHSMPCTLSPSLSGLTSSISLQRASFNLLTPLVPLKKSCALHLHLILSWSYIERTSQRADQSCPLPWDLTCLSCSRAQHRVPWITFGIELLNNLTS